MFIEYAIFLAYAVTIISETCIILVIQRPLKIWQWVFAIFLINSFTHPIAIYLLRIKNLPYIPVELGVFAIEFFWYWVALKISWKRSFILSGTANAFSILVGIGVRFLFGF